MSNIALYRKYRSKSFSDIVGQDHITRTLESALKNGRLSHAYLFTGPRGVGKTSVARILAHAVNDLDYQDESANLDIIEIDAASNRRIDEIRDLREKVHTAPTSSKYKVYIIDEAHMLTKEAFNALLKTLEEPPKHVIFILATTEAHKLPETIVSRTQRFTFKAIDGPKAIGHLRQIADQEGLEISDEALELLADYANGSFRDSISMLDQLSGKQKINTEDVREILGIAAAETIDTLIGSLFNCDTAVIVKTLQLSRESGVAAPQIAKQLARKLRSMVLDDSVNNKIDVVAFLGQLVMVSSSPNPEISLEITLLDFALKAAPNNIQTISSPNIETMEPENNEINEGAKVILKPDTETSDINNWWNAALDEIRSSNNTLYGIARMAKPELSDDTLTLRLAFAFHLKRLKESRNLSLISQQVEKLSGRKLKLNLILDESLRQDKTNDIIDNVVKNQSSNTGKLMPPASITAIFGGGEVLED